MRERELVVVGHAEARSHYGPSLNYPHPIGLEVWAGMSWTPVLRSINVFKFHGNSDGMSTAAAVASGFVICRMTGLPSDSCLGHWKP